MAGFRLGTVGFGYRDWVGPFYPRDLGARDYLSFYSRYFDTVELDTTFHAVPREETVRRWAAETPEGFCFCVKAPRSVSHAPGLAGAAETMRGFLDVMRALERKLGVVLVQYPPSFTIGEFGQLEAFLASLPADVRFAFEFRDPSWRDGRTAALLQSRGCGWVAADFLTEPASVRATADFLYVRWIGRHGRFARNGHEQLDVTERLQWWRSQLTSVPARVQTVWGMFNNDFSGYAVSACNQFKALLGLPARAPSADVRGELFS